MNIQYCRASSYNTYYDCQCKYFYEYVLNLPSPAGKKANLGTIVHLVLEILAKAKKTNHHLLHDKFTDYRWLLGVVIKRFSQEETRWKYTEDDIKFCIKNIENVLNSTHSPLSLDILKTEQRFQIPIMRPEFHVSYYDLIKKQEIESWFELRGTVDLIYKIDNETLGILDWKTGERKCWIKGTEKQYEDFENDFQLRMYDLAVSLLYPQYKHRLITIFFTRSGGPFTVSFSDKQREETYNLILKHYNEAKRNNLPTRIKEEKRDQLWKCEYVCHFGKTKDQNGHSICDRLNYYLNTHGIDQTIIRVNELKTSSKSEDKSVGNRRNVY